MHNINLLKIIMFFIVFQKTFQHHNLEGNDKITLDGKEQLIPGHVQVQSVSFVRNTMFWKYFNPLFNLFLLPLLFCRQFNLL